VKIYLLNSFVNHSRRANSHRTSSALTHSVDRNVDYHNLQVSHWICDPPERVMKLFDFPLQTKFLCITIIIYCFTRSDPGQAYNFRRTTVAIQRRNQKNQRIQVQKCNTQFNEK